MVVSPTSQEGALQVASARYTVAPACAPPVTRLCEGVTAAAMDDYRSALAVAHSHPWSWLLCPQPPGDPTCARIVHRNWDWPDWRGLAFHGAWHDDVL